ncbi:MAG: hypothetical protein SFX73_14000 [Kofleriaceae bacterium]|nr:hypothetical protein [Kofleriaceae bacterium]
MAKPFGRALEELARYARDVHARADMTTIASDRRTVYRHLSNIQVSLQRTVSDPPPAGREAWAWIPVVSAAERVADQITHASVARAPPHEELACHVDDLVALVAQERKEDLPERRSSPPRHGGDHPDAAVRELADELANLEPMLARTGPPRRC